MTRTSAPPWGTAFMVATALATTNHVHAGLSHVGLTTNSPLDFAGPEALETAIEVGAAYSSTFTSRSGVTSEILRLQRTSAGGQAGKATVKVTYAGTSSAIKATATTKITVRR